MKQLLDLNIKAKYITFSEENKKNSNDLGLFSKFLDSMPKARYLEENN